MTRAVLWLIDMVSCEIDFNASNLTHVFCVDHSLWWTECNIHPNFIKRPINVWPFYIVPIKGGITNRKTWHISQTCNQHLERLSRRHWNDVFLNFCLIIFFAGVVICIITKRVVYRWWLKSPTTTWYTVNPLNKNVDKLPTWKLVNWNLQPSTGRSGRCDFCMVCRVPIRKKASTSSK